MDEARLSTTFAELTSEGDERHPPFRWQIRLLRRLLDVELPRAVDIPTGLGKFVLHHKVHAINWSVQMGQYTDLGTAPRYRLEVSITRSESVAVVVEGSLEDVARGTSFHHESTAAPSSPGLFRLLSPRSLEPSRKPLDRRRK